LLHDPESFRSALTEQYSITHRQILGPLHEAERHCRPVSGADILAVDVDDGARLADGSDVQHGLVFGPDRGGVGQDEDLCDEVAVHLRRGGGGRAVELGQHDHAFADFFAADTFQGERGALAGAAHGYGDAFALNGADVGGLELAERVGPDQHRVAGVDDAGLDNAGDDGADEGDGEGVVDVEFEGCLGIVVAVVREDVEEGTHEVEAFAGHVGDLEDGADALGDELSGGRNGLLAVLDQNGDFACPGGFQDAGYLGDGLFEDVGRADVDFGNDDHDGDVKGQSDAEVFFGHADQAVVGGDHEEAVVGRGGEEAEDGGAEVALVAGEVGEGDYFSRARADFGPGELAAGDVAGDDVTVRIETHDFHTDGGGSAGLDLVFVAEEVDTGFAAAVVEVSFDEDAEHGGFAGVDVTDNSDSGFDHLLWCGWSLTDEELAVAGLVFWILSLSFVGTFDVVCEENSDICFQCAGRLAESR